MENCFFIAAKVKDIQQNVKKCFSICKHLQKDNVDGAIQAVLLPFCDPFCLFIKKKDQKGRSKVTSYFFNIKVSGSIVLSAIAGLCVVSYRLRSQARSSQARSVTAGSAVMRAIRSSISLRSPLWMCTSSLT